MRVCVCKMCLYLLLLLLLSLLSLCVSRTGVLGWGRAGVLRRLPSSLPRRVPGAGPLTPGGQAALGLPSPRVWRLRPRPSSSWRAAVQVRGGLLLVNEVGGGKGGRGGGSMMMRPDEGLSY